MGEVTSTCPRAGTNIQLRQQLAGKCIGAYQQLRAAERNGQVGLQHYIAAAAFKALTSTCVITCTPMPALSVAGPVPVYRNAAVLPYGSPPGGPLLKPNAFTFYPPGGIPSRLLIALRRVMFKPADIVFQLLNLRVLLLGKTARSRHNVQSLSPSC